MAQERLEKFLRESPGVKSVLGAQIKNVEGFTTLRGTKTTDTVSETDLPELRLEPVLMPCNANFASNAASLDYTLRIVMNTGDQRVNYKMLPLVFAVFAAIVSAINASELLDLQWEGYNFLKNFTFSNVAAGLSDPVENRGIAGWSAICDLTLHMIFPATLLRSFHSGQL
jgi:hypothetical protein